MSYFSIFPNSPQHREFWDTICSCCGSSLTSDVKAFRNMNQGYTLLVGQDASFVPEPDTEQEYVLEAVTLPDGQTLFIKINTETEVHCSNEEDDDEF